MQESSPKIDGVRQEESPGQQRKSGSDARRVNQDWLIEPSRERHSKRTSQDHNERVSAWAEKSVRETRAYAMVYCKDKLCQIMKSRQKKGRVCRSSVGYKYVAQSLNKDNAGKRVEHSNPLQKESVRARSHDSTPRKEKQQSSQEMWRGDKSNFNRAALSPESKRNLSRYKWRVQDNIVDIEARMAKRDKGV